MPLTDDEFSELINESVQVLAALDENDEVNILISLLVNCSERRRIFPVLLIQSLSKALGGTVAINLAPGSDARN